MSKYVGLGIRKSNLGKFCGSCRSGPAFVVWLVVRFVQGFDGWVGTDVVRLMGGGGSSDEANAGYGPDPNRSNWANGLLIEMQVNGRVQGCWAGLTA